MDSELAPQFIYDQGMYYPAASNYYGYVCTGMEPTTGTDWDDHHTFLDLDGQDIQFPGLQTENLPRVYYTPTYDYAQSSYNPYNPYIPGAVVGTDGSYMGTQQCLTNSPYMQTVSPPPYIPLLSQSGSDPVPNAFPDQMIFNNGAVKYAPSMSSMNVTTTPLKVAFENWSPEPSHPYSHQIQIAGRLPEAAGVNAAPRKKLLPYGDFANASGPQISQLTEHSSRGVSSVLNSLKVALPANNGFTFPGSNVHRWAPADRMMPSIPYSGVPNRVIGEQNMGPRTNKPRAPLTSPIALKAYTTKAGTVNLDGTIIVHTEQYNRDDFSVDYPDAKFFVIKSYSEDDVHKSIKYNVWSSTSSGNNKLDIAYEEAQRSSVGKPRKCPVFLFFSVNASGHFCGVAEMVGPVDFNKDMDFWLQDKWTGSFPVKWHIIKDVPNLSFRHIILVNNEFRSVTSSRDTQEVHYLPGMKMLTIFKNCLLKTSILDDFMHYEERQRIMQEEKSLLLGRKSYETNVSPLIAVPFIKPVVTISHPLWAGEPQANSAGTQPSVVASEKDANVKADHVLESDRSKQTSHNVDQDPKEDVKQTSHNVDQDPKEDEKKKVNESSCAPSHGGQLNGAANHPSKSDGHLSSDTNLPAESDGRSINRSVKKLSLETKSNQTKNHILLKSTDGSAPSNVLAVSRDAKMDLQDKMKGRPQIAVGVSNAETCAGMIGSANASKIDRANVLTVGSMQIEITDVNRRISGILTIGAIPVDTKGLKS